MTFKEVKLGHTMYMFDKGKMECSPCQALSVSTPYYLNNGLLTRVIDIKIGDKTYVVPEDASITYSNDLVIAPDKSSIIFEVLAIKGVAENVVNSYEENKQILCKCECILELLDDSLAEKKKYDKRFENIEEKLELLLLKLGNSSN